MALILTDRDLRGVLTPLPLKQGLKHLISDATIGQLERLNASSIKTRIETISVRKEQSQMG